MSSDGDAFNALARDSLIGVISRNRSRHELLVLDRTLSPLLNRLCQFLLIKEAARIDKVIWLDELAKKGLPKDTRSFLVLMDLLTENFDSVYDIFNSCDARATIIAHNLSSEMVLRVSQYYGSKLITFNSLLNSTSAAWQVLSRLKLCRWEIPGPLQIEGGHFLLSLFEKYGGIGDYFKRPLNIVQSLSSAVVSVLFADESRPIKIRNCYAKGDHAALVVNTIQEKLVPHHLASVLDRAQADYYREKLAGLVDLVVLDRNLDYLPCLFDQTSYHGVLDDFFGINLDQLNVKPFAESVDPSMVGDDMYDSRLKHVNFAGVGPILNEMAKQVQNQFSDAAGQNQSITEIQKMVADLGELTALQESVKRHTTISARIVQDIDAEYEAFLAFQNDIWDTDYRGHVATLQNFLNMGFDASRILAATCLVSIIHDGLAARDFESLSSLLFDIHGLEAVLALEQLCALFLVRVAEKTDFLSSLIPAPSTGPAAPPKESASLGITGALDSRISKHSLICKFWNLHPSEEQATQNTPEKLLSPLHALPGFTVSLLYRLVESLFFRDFLTYKPVNNVKRRPNWDNLGLDQMLKGQTLDLNIDDRRDRSRRGDQPIPPSLKVLVVVIVGGVTRSELTCFQHLEKRLQQHHKHEKVLVISNGILNRARLFDHLNSNE